MEVADHRRGPEVPSGQIERVLRGHIQAGQPQPCLVLAPLRDRIGEHVELGQRHVEPQPEEGEPPLLFHWRRVPPGPLQPLDVAADLLPERPPPTDQVMIDSRLRRG